MTSPDRWTAAQIGERSFHCDTTGWPASLEARRAHEHVQRGYYAGLLGIGYGPVPESVTDIGCGPESLLLTAPARGTMVAVDPTAFLAEDEARYAAHGIQRAVMPAEDYVGPQTEEVWMYNCLQHTIDPRKVLAVVTAHAAVRVRIFEWTHVPTDGLHLHTLSEGMLIQALKSGGFAMERETLGRMVDPAGRTNFYAAVWRRV